MRICHLRGAYWAWKPWKRISFSSTTNYLGVIMKELVRRLRTEPTNGESLEAADVIERLENEALAATLRIENDRLEIAKLRNAYNAVVGPLTDERDVLRAELDALKQQEPVAYVATDALEYIQAGGTRFEALAPSSDVAEDGGFTPLYLAAGAKPDLSRLEPFVHGLGKAILKELQAAKP